MNHWKQHEYASVKSGWVVICFQISIFEPLETACFVRSLRINLL
ncbi:hypothetical protein M105_4720 [Bacteroides fragilis str. 1009-4-F |nr:hypothetical protein M105_4720 [Bacteroides fragilis str. 1009-4-F \